MHSHGEIAMTITRSAFGAGLVVSLVLSSAAVMAAEVDGGRIIAADKEPQNWLSHGRTYGEQRFSPLAKITTANVGQLGLAWSHDIASRTARGVEATAIVVDGVMYTTGAWSHVHALDARTGKLLWEFDPQISGAYGAKGCCDVVNRGVAVWAGKVYVGAFDGRLIALDAKTGKKVWETLTVDQSQACAVTGAPRVVKGKVIVGSGGADFGVRGYVSADDAETGTMAWRFYTVPGNPKDGFESKTVEMIAKTWNGEWWRRGGGGTVWDSMAYDPNLDLLYIGVGNGGPWNYTMRSDGKGDNLFLASIVAIRPDTGEYIWHFQTTPGEDWDYTATQHMIQADLTIDGRARKVLMVAADVLQPRHGTRLRPGSRRRLHVRAGRSTILPAARGSVLEQRPPCGRGVVSQLLHEVPRPRDGGRWRRDRSAVLGHARLSRGLPGGRARRRPHAQRHDLVLRFLEAGRRGGDSRLRDRAGAPRAEAVESVNPQVLVELGDAEADLGRRALEDDAPAVEDDDVVGNVEDQLGVLLHEDDGEPLGLEATDRRHHLGHDLRRQSFRGLVHQQHPGVRHQRAGDREHLLLAARERSGDLVPALAQAWEERRHGVERPQHRQITARPASGHREILAHGEAPKDAAALGHERDAVGGYRLRGAPGDGPAVDRHHAVSRRQQAHDDVQRRRLARTVAAEQAEQAALGEPQRHAVEHVAVAVERVDLAQHERVTRQDRSPACAGGRRPHPACPRRPPGRSAAR